MADDARWVWLDLEMTGLDDKTCVIVQMAMIVTDGSLNELAMIEQTIWQPESALDAHARRGANACARSPA